MNIQSIGGKDFLVVDTINESRSLNPFSINVSQIRYLREYTTNNKKPAWAVIIGDKMFATESIDIDASELIAGEIYKVGSVDFLCVVASSLTQKFSSKHLINFEKILYMRKFFEKGEGLEKSNKNDSKSDDISSEINKFAIITVDNRTIPIEDFMRIIAD
jgi:hypothetical protein